MFLSSHLPMTKYVNVHRGANIGDKFDTNNKIFLPTNHGENLTCFRQKQPL